VSIDAARVSSPSDVAVGKVVQVGPNSSATVYFANGCTAVIGANESLTIPEVDPLCSGVVTTGGEQSLLVVGGLVVAGGAAAIILSRDSDSRSVSP
jgi:hypothetical protein